MNRAWVVRAAASAVAVAAVGLVWAQPPDGKLGFINDGKLDNTCLRCHEVPRPKDKETSGKFVLLTESVYWGQHDLHRRAFEVLSSPLGQQMSQLLYNDPKAAATKPSCLVCHATDTSPTTPLDKKQASQFECDYGINCQACHGPANAWWSEHIDPKWREVNPKMKASYGQAHLREPSVRAEKCAGCHVGSAAEGKFVTHDMYAAGHPPLPAFELATFCRDEVRHWRHPADVPYITSLAPDAAKERFGYRKGEVEAARLAAVGAVVSFRESVALLKDPPAGGLDFSHFNCAACHHDLRIPSDRQTNGFPGVPGRPVPQTWPLWLTRVVLDHAAAANPDVAALKTRFNQDYDQLRAAFDARPFGDPELVKKAAGDLVKTCNDLLAALDKVDYTEAAAWGLLGKLAEAATAPPDGKRRDFIDPDAAGQIARATAAIYTELAGGPGGSTGLAISPDAPPAGPPAFDQMKSDPKGIGKILADLNAVVPLTVREDYRNGLKADGKPGDAADTFLIQHPSRIGKRLDAQSRFKSADFQSAFTRIARQLGVPVKDPAGRPPG